MLTVGCYTRMCRKFSLDQRNSNTNLGAPLTRFPDLKVHIGQINKSNLMKYKIHSWWTKLIYLLCHFIFWFANKPHCTRTPFCQHKLNALVSRFGAVYWVSLPWIFNLRNITGKLRTWGNPETLVQNFDGALGFKARTHRWERLSHDLSLTTFSQLEPFQHWEQLSNQ